MKQRIRAIIPIIALLLGTAATAAYLAAPGAGADPVSRGGGSVSALFGRGGPLGPPLVHRYIGHERPRWLFDDLRRQQAQLLADQTARERNLTNSPSADSNDPAWSPRGDYVLFSSIGTDASQDPGPPTGDGKWRFHAVGTKYNLWVMDADGGNWQQLTGKGAADEGNNYQPAWFPAANKVAFISDRTGVPQVWTGNLSAGVEFTLTASVLTTDLKPKSYPTVGATQQIIFTVTDPATGDTDLMIVAPDGSTISSLLTGPTADSDPVVARDGVTVAFVRDTGTAKKIYLTDIFGTAPTPAPVGGTATSNEIHPFYNVRTNVLYYASDRDTPRDTTEGSVADHNIWYGTGPEVVNYDYHDLVRDDQPTPSTVTPNVIYRTERGGDSTHHQLWITKPISVDFVPPEMVNLPREVDPERNPAAVFPRTGNPGRTVTIYARVWDEYDVTDDQPPFVYEDDVTGKRVDQNPATPEFDPQVGTRTVMANIISASEYADPTITGFQGYSKCNASVWISHYYVFGIPGYLNIPTPVGQVELKDDGVAPDAVKGDRIYTAQWTTPAAQDEYYLHITTEDYQGNSFLYDNVWGFSCKPFVATSKVLVVSDYGVGQMFAAFPARLTSPARYNFLDPTESYWTRHPGTQIVNATIVPGSGVTDDTNQHDAWFGTGPFTDNLLDLIYPVLGLPFPLDRRESYELWRTLCRGPVTQAVWDYYAPRTVSQPNPIDPIHGTPITAIDAPRAVLWGSPYAGDLWVGRGTIVDSEVQSDLAAFLDRGGRLMVSGEDIGWALTLDTTGAGTAFLTNYLKAIYVRDDAVGADGVYWHFPIAVGDVLGQEPANAGSVLDRWPQVYPFNFPNPPADDPPALLNTPDTRGLVNTADPDMFDDACINQRYPDGIDPAGDGSVVMTYQGAIAGSAGIWYDNLAGGSRMLYMAFGFEAVHREYEARAVGNITLEWCRNFRSKLEHNILCWLRTARLKGTVVNTYDLRPIPKAVVIVQAGGVTRTGLSDTSGQYVVDGIPAGSYGVSAKAGGYLTYDKATGNYFHGGSENKIVDFRLTPAEPGSISGRVLELETNNPIMGATVTAELNGYYNGAPFRTQTTSLADGTYMLARLPVGDYTLNATAVKHGPDPNAPFTITVTAATETKGVDFHLPTGPGAIAGTVTDAASANPIAGATITVDDNPLLSATSDASGNYRIPATGFTVPPGTRTVRCTFIGYVTQTKSAQVTADEVTDVDFALATAPPGSISGRVTAQIDGSYLGGLTVRVHPRGRPDLPPLYTGVTSATPTTAPDGYVYNYLIANVPTGDYTVTVAVTDMTTIPVSRDISVTSATETRNVTFVVASLHTFAPGVSLMAIPYTYAPGAGDPSTVLSLSAGDLTGDLATYLTDTGTYAVYPNPPTNQMQLGRGYFIRSTVAFDVRKTGTPAGVPVDIPLLAGWNLIGAPYPDKVADWFGSQVVMGAATKTVAQAVADGDLGSALFTYLGGGYQLAYNLQPFTGYWVLANKALTLRIPNSALSPASLAGAPRRAPMLGDGWMTCIQAGVGVAWDSIYVGQSSAATQGLDRAWDMPKPPAPLGAAAVQIYIDHPNWGSQSGRYITDLVDSRSDSATWQFAVATAAPDLDVTLTWPDLATVPRDRTAVLTDLDTGAKTSMSGGATYYRYNSGPTNAERHFSVTVAKPTTGSLSVVIGPPGSKGRGTATIPLTLTKNAYVTVQVKTLTGQVVRRLLQDELMTAGQNNIFWDGTSDQGSSLPNGFYLFEVQAKTETGEAFQAFRAIQRLQ